MRRHKIVCGVRWEEIAPFPKQTLVSSRYRVPLLNLTGFPNEELQTKIKPFAQNVATSEQIFLRVEIATHGARALRQT